MNLRELWNIFGVWHTHCSFDWKFLSVVSCSVRRTLAKIVIYLLPQIPSSRHTRNWNVYNANTLLVVTETFYYFFEGLQEAIFVPNLHWIYVCDCCHQWKHETLRSIGSSLALNDFWETYTQKWSSTLMLVILPCLNTISIYVKRCVPLLASLQKSHKKEYL